MNWNPYQDQKNRAFSGILTALFPEQTRTLPRILVWSVIFLIDLTILAFTGLHFYLLIATLFTVFWLQGFLWGLIQKLRTRRKEKDHAPI